jgi:hypothetical protein
MTLPRAIRHWSILTELNGLGEVVMSFALGSREDECVVLVFGNPRTGNVIRAVQLTSEGEQRTLASGDLPYCVRDVAETLTQEHFPLRGRV